METLYIDHNIFLNKKQIKKLISGDVVSAVGVSLHVPGSDKFNDPKNFNEYFCLYKLIPKKYVYKSIYNKNYGYDVYLSNNKCKENVLDYFKRIIFSKYENQEDVKKLSDISDGGSEWMFLLEQNFKKDIVVFHKMQIQKIEVLNESLI